MAKAVNANGSDLVCDECQGKPDFIYFIPEERKLLSIICNDCKAAIEATIKAMGESFGIH